MAIKIACVCECICLVVSVCVLLCVYVVLKEKAVPKSPKSHRPAVPSGRARQRKVSLAVFVGFILLN